MAAGTAGSWGTAASGWQPAGAPAAASWGSIAPSAPGAEGAEPARDARPVVDDVDEDGEDDEIRPRHPYTIAHMLVLVLVAFILGFLIVLLAAKAHPGDKPTPHTTGASQSATYSTRGVL